MNLSPEQEEGNIEYKRKLIPNDSKLLRLKNQLLWRLTEGYRNNGIYQAVYYIGVEDDGTISNIDMSTHSVSINCLKKLVKDCDAEIIDSKIYNMDSGIFSKHTVRKKSTVKNLNEIKVALIGPVDQGKSTLIGVLTYDYKDNGQGSARSSIFRYDHEMKNGKTASIKYELLGYKDGKQINYNSDIMSSWENIVEKSEKLIYFIDLPGDIKYEKTTLFGIMAHKPDYIMIVTSVDNLQIQKYIELCENLNIPFFIVITKIDKLNGQMVEHKFKNKVVQISNITKQNYDQLHTVLESLPQPKKSQSYPTKNVKFLINQVFYISDVGIVVMGILFSGIIKVNDQLFIGPHKNTFFNGTIISIHKKQIPCDILNQNETACLVIKFPKKYKVTKHMMVVDQNGIDSITDSFYIQIDKKVNIKNKNVIIFVNNVYGEIKTYYEDNRTLIKVRFIDNKKKYIRNGEKIVIRYNSTLLIGTTSIDCSFQ